MKALIYNNDTLVSICEDDIEFETDWIKDLYGDGELSTQHIDMTVDQFKKHPHSIVDGQVVVDVDTIIDIPESAIPKPTPEELKIKELETQLAGLQSAMAELTMMMTTP
ncbi:hypothetical protein KQI88_15990 [Alkaliphilus sp. MSJ-5]|uniref:Uncharacterized protein n=1 Tax=Alkaliphilus flagellatus TaxID=2841507 RepID=A0ABS6G604_9FIRM|nr:hypothetical protein [Alkaliphilus flagellatus]MBU5677919.1 hypothetical protein [Alkaliphilus flagellatus]